MDNQELLQAIGQMMDEKLAANNESLRQEMAAQEKRTDEKFSGLRQEMATKRDISEVKAVMENIYQRIENLLREDYDRVEGNAAKGAAAADSCKEMRSTQADHARAIQQHNERITVLEEKAI